MAAGDWWGQQWLGIGQAQQQYGGLLNAWTQQNIYAAGGTAGAINVGNIQVYSPSQVLAVKARAPETALEWLDRRVDELRVRL